MDRKGDNQKGPGSTHETLREHFEHVYDLYSNEIFRFCVLKVSDRERAQDLTQEVFMRYWQTVRVGKRINNERAYLYTLARNLVIDWYRRKKESSLDTLTEAGIEFPSADDHSIVAHAEAEEVLRFMRHLDQDSREVLLLRFVEGLSPKDIALIRKETANAVSVRINRAVKKIQESMSLKSTEQKT